MRKTNAKFMNLLILPKLGRSFYHVAVSYRLVYVLVFALAGVVAGGAVFVSDYRELKKEVAGKHDDARISAQVDDLSKTAERIESELDLLEKANRRIEEKTGIKVDSEQKYDSGYYPSRGGNSLGDIQTRFSDLSLKIQESRQKTQKTEQQVDRLLGQMASIPTICPLRQKNFSSGFGYRIHPLSGRWEFHEGVDLKMPSGSPIYAAADGIVDLATWHYGYGQVVFLKHASGFSTRYAHCSRLVVREGEKVRKGQIIAFVGRTGTTTGNHLHYEVRYKNQLLNPMKFLNLDFKDLSRL